MSNSLRSLSNQELQDLEAWTPTQVHQRFRKVSQRMLEVINERRTAGNEWAIAKANLASKASRCRITQKNEANRRGHKLTSADLDAIVSRMTETEQLKLDIADETKRALDLEARMLSDVLGMLRSINKDTRMVS